MSKLVAAFLVVSAFAVSVQVAFSQNVSAGNSVLINRQKRQLTINDSSGHVLLTSPVGIGRGPLKKKTSMHDCITPTGKFRIDVILAENPDDCAIDRSLKNTLAKNPHNAIAVRSPERLSALFKAMNAVDFNKDGTADGAYGFAFIGLDGEQTGPKLVPSGSGVRWYSIALHGSPHEEKAVGNATSEGCVHLKEEVLKDILNRHLVNIGTQVVIVDSIDVKH